MRSLLSANVITFLLLAPHHVAAQGNPEPHSFKFNTGQGVTPIFEGWARNPDGNFQMYFGYFNRNYVETLIVPVGADNKLEPGVPDRGQPTVFNTRIRRQQFSVTVPKDWGKKELVWSVTVRGVTERAIAWLQPEWEIDPIYAGKTLSEESKKNTAPMLTLTAPSSATVNSPLNLNAAVQDDGLPKPRARGRQAAVGQETPPALKPDADQPEVPVNVPSIGAARGRGPNQGPQGPTVTWIAWRGPAPVAFENGTAAAVRDGKTVTSATFTKSGTYILRARASDGELWDEKDVTVTVK